MSSTTIKALWLGDRHEDITELRNSHGSAPVVWGEMSARYLGCERFAYWQHTDKLWPLYKRQDIPVHQRAVLTMTYDNAYVSKANYKRAAADIRAFLADFPQDENYMNHWPAIAEIFESEPEYPAIGFHWTSVNCDPFNGEWDDELDDYGPTDWARLWEVYDTLSCTGA